MRDLRCRQRMLLQIFSVAFPAERLPLTAPVQPFHRQNECSFLVVAYHNEIAAHPIISVVSGQFCFQYLPPFLYSAYVSHRFQPCVHFSAFLSELLPACLSSKQKSPLAALPAIVRKTKTVKGVGFAILSPRVFFFIPPETYHAAFLRVQFQPVFRETRLHSCRNF